MQFNISEIQTKIIHHESGPLLVIAGPGSGKTFVITKRIEYLLKNHIVKPTELLVITFTKAAAIEMKNRAIGIIPSADYVQFGTFHAVFLQIIKKISKYQSLSLISINSQVDYIKIHFQSFLPNQKFNITHVNVIISLISYFKNHTNKEMQQQYLYKFYQDVEFEHIAKCINQYNNWLRENNWLDFDDMVYLCHEELNRDEYLRKLWQAKFQYILVDEFQDINELQYDTLKLLCGNGNIMVVGDDDQSIYGFRGSSPQFIEQFQIDWNIAPVVLNENYRSAKGIIQLANKSIHCNLSRFQKEIVAMKQEQGEVICKGFDSLQLMTEFVANETRNLHNEYAVLVRTNSQMEPYRYSYGKTINQSNHSESSIEQEIRKDFWHYFRFAKEGHKRSDFRIVMNKPMRYISEQLLIEEVICLETLKQYYQTNPNLYKIINKMEQQFVLLKSLDAYSGAMLIWNGFQYKDYIYGKYSSNTNSIPKIKIAFENIMRELKSNDYECLQEIKQFSEDNSGKGKLNIYTYHAVKGLEFNTVILPELNIGIVPHGKLLSVEEIEEERRMFYVAITRAKQKIYFLYIKQGEDGKAGLSPFLKELKIDENKT